MADRYCHYPSK